MKKQFWSVLALAGLVATFAALPAAEPAPMPRAKEFVRVDPVPPPAIKVPTLTAPESIEVEPGDIYTIKATTSAKWVEFWFPDGGNKQIKLEDLFEGAKLKVGTYVGQMPKTAVAGTKYRIFIYAGDANNPAVPVICTLSVKGDPVPPPVPPNPPVPPTPPVPPNPPTPPVPPAPSAAPAYFIVVEDSGQAGQWRGNVLGSPKVEQFYKALRGTRTGAIHRLIDKPGVDSDLANGVAVDPLAAWATKAAVGKTLPYLWILDNGGAVVKEGQAPTTDDGFIAMFHVGKPVDHKLGLIEVQGGYKLGWTKFGKTENTPLIDRSLWKDITLKTFLSPVYNQANRGQCVASSTDDAFEACRAQAGLPYVYLSAGDLYSNINGGRDDGAMLEDAMAWMLSNGTATVKSVPYVWDGRRYTSAAIVAERKNYRLTEVFLCTSFDAAASAIQQGFHLEEALSWYGGWMNGPGNDGWIRSKSGGVVGGHALHGYGLRKHPTTGEWGLETKNSWTATWGGSQDGSVPAGCCILSEKVFDNIANQGFFAIRSVTQTTPASIPFPKTSLDPFKRNHFKEENNGFALAP